MEEILTSIKFLIEEKFMDEFNRYKPNAHIKDGSFKCELIKVRKKFAVYKASIAYHESWLNIITYDAKITVKLTCF